MKSLQFTRYRPDYLEQILALHRSIVSELTANIGFPIGISQDEEEADLRTIEQTYLQNGGEFLVGLLEGEIIAMGGFRRLSDTSAELRRMRIRKDFQDKGCGSKLLKELENRAMESGIRMLSFETARARSLTLKFYHKHNYRETGHGYYGKVETVYFSKTLEE
jgi:GNAT superfamily N-acetyltransferase